LGLAKVVFWHAQCIAEDDCYAFRYYSTVAARQMIQNEKLAVEFRERSFHVFISITL
jgi:hypothetical protein